MAVKSQESVFQNDIIHQMQAKGWLLGSPSGYNRGSRPLMGMQSLDKKSDVAIRKRDASIAKNYLNEDEMKLLGLLVEQYLAFAETMAQQQTPMYMKDWVERLDAIIQLNGRELLSHAGKISHALALEKSRTFRGLSEDFPGRSSDYKFLS